MEYSETQYERVARYLDGEPIELSADEQALADEMAHLDGALAGALDVAVPASAIEAARGRGRSAMAAGLRPVGRQRSWWIGVASAAAVVAFVASVWMMTATRAPTDRGGNSGGGNVSELTEAEIYEDVVAATSADELTTDFELIDEDVAELESEMLASMDEPGEMFPNTDALIDATDDRLEELSTYDPFEGLGG